MLTREGHLKFCKICQHQKFDINRGIICSLSDALANFEDSCEHFTENQKLKEDVDFKKAEMEILENTASHGKRFANYLIDLICLIVLNAVFGFFLGLLLAFRNPDALQNFEENNFLLNYLFGFVVGVFYYSLFEYTMGRSIAKLITGTKVVDEHGNKPNFQTILIRSACRFIPFEPFSFLGSGGGWHDTISGTRVVNC